MSMIERGRSVLRRFFRRPLKDVFHNLFWLALETGAGIGLVVAFALLTVESLNRWDALGEKRADRLAIYASVLVGIVALIGLEFARRTSEATVKHRFTDRKQALYTDLWVACDRHRQEVENQVAWRRGTRDGKSPTVGSSEPAERAWLAFALLPVPGLVRAAAERLFWQTRDLGPQFARKEEDPWTPGEEWEAAIASWSMGATTFTEAAQKDLEHPE